MARFDEHALAMHIEAALSCAPRGTAERLADADQKQRQRATRVLADSLAQRLRGYDISPAPASFNGTDLFDQGT